MTTERSVTLVIPIALCGHLLGKNQGRNWHWAKIQKAFDDQKQWAANCVKDDIACETLATDTWPWPATFMHIDWQYNRGRPPDDDNAVARLAAVRDAFEDVGVVADDRHIRIGTVTFTKVSQKDDPVAIITLEAA